MTKFSREVDVQQWLERVIASDTLNRTIEGAVQVRVALSALDSDEFLHEFPTNYLVRRSNLRAAAKVLDSIDSLDIVSSSNRSISSEKGESLFADLLCCARELSQFVLFEIKNQKATTREAISELMAYEHEVLNHMPFLSANDLMMVLISRDFPPLLNHAIAGLNTWARRRVLCLKFTDDADEPSLIVHIPKAWSAIGQKGLPPSGLVTAALSFEPRKGLSDHEARALCSTASALMVREAERSGGSGFAMVMHNQLFPTSAEGPFLLLVGAINPFGFVGEAHASGFLVETKSPIAEYLLEDDRSLDLAISWDWLSCDEGAASEFLEAYGRTTWEAFSTWQELRDVRRWRSSTITMDRHLTPVLVDFWGALGDVARDQVRHVRRMRNFNPGFAHPGIDWRNPTVGVGLLDEVASASPIDSGEWTFSALFNLGLRLGRLGAFCAQFADADENQKQKLLAALFWAKADAFVMLREVSMRYLAAKEINVEPPRLSIDGYGTSKEVIDSISAFAQWFIDHFLGDTSKLLIEAFVIGTRIHVVFDPQFDPFGDNEDVSKSRLEAAKTAKHWLKSSVVSATSNDRDAHVTRQVIEESFGELLDLNQDKDKIFEMIDGLAVDLLIDRLFIEIPKIVDLWHPQLAHTLAPIAQGVIDWEWYKDQILAARARGEKNPCIYVSAGGHICVGRIPEGQIAPAIEDWENEVLYVNNESGFEITLVVTWENLSAGVLPSMR